MHRNGRTRDPWTPRPPRGADGEDHEGGASSRAWQRARFIAVDLGEVLHDMAVTGCDVAAVLIRSGDGRRIRVTETRLREVAPVRAAVTFTRCSLAGTDFTGTTFDHVTFHDCDGGGPLRRRPGSTRRW